MSKDRLRPWVLLSRYRLVEVVPWPCAIDRKAHHNYQWMLIRRAEPLLYGSRPFIVFKNTEINLFSQKL